MTEAQTILELIEGVDPADTAAMDEIDLAVINEFWPETAAYHIELGYNNPKYTRSRDALKSIRPEGWGLESIISEKYNRVRVFQTHGKSNLKSEYLPNEELAELHAIIQAIQYERDNK